MEESLKRYIVGKLNDMQNEKKKDNQYPSFVTKNEFMQAVDADVRLILNNMFIKKEIKVHKTIHAPIHDYIEFVTKEDNEKL